MAVVVFRRTLCSFVGHVYVCVCVHLICTCVLSSICFSQEDMTHVLPSSHQKVRCTLINVLL